MTVESWIQLGTLLFVGLGMLGTVTWRLVGYINSVDDKRSKNVADLHEKIDDASDSLDGKFNHAMAEIGRVKDDTVRRDDLNLHLARIERAQEATAVALDRLREGVNAGLLRVIERVESGNHQRQS